MRLILCNFYFVYFVHSHKNQVIYTKYLSSFLGSGGNVLVTGRLKTQCLVSGCSIKHQEWHIWDY